MYKILLGVFLAAGFLVAIFVVFSKPENPSENLPVSQLSIETSTPAPPTPTLIIMPNQKYSALIKTSVGDMLVDLNASATPKTVNNFVTLSKKGFYNGTIFHRVISGFMIQGGDPKGNGTGGPGYTFADEPFTGEYSRGTIAMANSGPNTNGSQFFIMHQDRPLPPNYVIFGHLVTGFETLDKIASATTSANVNMPGENSVPVSPIKVLSVTIEEK